MEKYCPDCDIELEEVDDDTYCCSNCGEYWSSEFLRAIDKEQYEHDRYDELRDDGWF